MQHCIIHVTAHQAVINQLINREATVFPSSKLDTVDPVEVYEGAMPVMSATWYDISLRHAWSVLEELAINPNPVPFLGDHGAAECGDGVCSGNFAGADGQFRHVASAWDGTGLNVVYDRKTLQPLESSLREAEDFQHYARLAETALFVTKPWFS